MIKKRAVKAIFSGMSYVDILKHINLSTIFINIQARSHKVNCLLPEKGMLTMICDVLMCTLYRLLGQIGTVHGEYDTGYDYNMCGILYIYAGLYISVICGYVMKLCSCNYAPSLPRCMAL